jgi:spermidine/putrescine transport system substrate-binding protein
MPSKDQPKTIGRRRLLGAAAALPSITIIPSQAWSQQNQVNVLAFTGYQEPGMLQPFEQATGIRVNLRIHSGSNEEIISILRTARPGEWDVVTPTSAYIPWAARDGLLRELDPADYPLEDYFELIRNWPLTTIGGKLFAIINRFGYYGIIYNERRFSAADVQSYDILFSERARRRLAMFDWYLPNMGVLSKYRGNKTAPYDLSPERFADLTQTLMRMRPSTGLVAPLAQVIQAMAAQSFDLAIGGEFIQAGLAKDGLPYKALVPREGGITWDQAPCIVHNTTRYENARRFMQYIAGPQFQARLAVANAYFSMVPNRKAAALLTREQRDLLNLTDLDRFNEEFLANLAPRVEPPNKEEWMRTWEQFKAA